MKGLRWHLVFFAAVVVCSYSIAAPQEKTVVVTRPTVIAFFPPVTDSELEKDPDTNEVLSDFQFYAAKARKQLRVRGIDFEEIYAASIRIKDGAKVVVFRPKNITVGYYFVAPGRAPRVQYGVMTDDGILSIASSYFDSKPQ